MSALASYGGQVDVPADGTKVALVSLFLPKGTYVLDVELESTLTARPNADFVGNGTILYGPSALGKVVYKTDAAGSLVTLRGWTGFIGTPLIVDFSIFTAISL